MGFISKGQKYSVGVKASPLISWPAFGDKEEKELFSREVSLGFAAGGVLSFPLKHDFDLFVEGGYSSKGRRMKNKDNGWVNNSRFGFIDGALLLRKSYKFRLEKNIPSFFYLNIGPEVSYWATAKGDILVDGHANPYEVVFNEPPDGNFNYMYLNDVNRWLFGLVIGIGVKAPMLRHQHITTELRFVSGHTFLGTSESSKIAILTFDDTMMTNLKTISINLAYTFDFDVQKSRKGKSTLDRKIKRRR